MRVVNIVTVKEGVVDEIESFGIFEEQLSQEVVEKAEQSFIEKAKALGFDNDYNPDTDLEETTDGDLLDNGYFCIANASVCISWSDI